MKLNRLEVEIGKAYQLLQQGFIDQCLSDIKNLLEKVPLQPDLIHLRALAHKKKGSLLEAKESFELSLQLKPKDPQINNNFANLLKDHGQYGEATSHYLAALDCSPNYHEARRNLGLCYAAQGKHVAALDCYQTILKIKPHDIVVKTAFANSLRNMEQYEEAQELYKQVLLIRPDYVNALYNLGLNYQLTGFDDDALVYYSRVMELNPSLAQAYEGAATILGSLGRVSQAVAILQQGVTNLPTNIQLHRRLNDLLWQTDEDRFGISYRSALDVHLDDSLLAAYLDQLMHAKQFSLAQSELDKFLMKSDSSASTFLAQGKLHAHSNELQSAYDAFEQGLSYGFNRSLAIEKLKLSLIIGDYSDSQALIDCLLADQPECQLTWAYQGLLWRECDDPRYHWLFDYDAFVKEIDLVTPDIYNSKSEFLDAIKIYLLAHHNLQKTPLEQSLRNGSQSGPNLLKHNSEEIVAIRNSIEQAISGYIASLPKKSDHPFLKRISKVFKFSGSWSVRLNSSGYHENHVHPEGWISSSCYITLPALVMNDETEEGFIQFGQSPFSLGDKDKADKKIKPKAGTVVLFPSYFWHGTVPFFGDESDYRLTLPFDVVPI